MTKAVILAGSSGTRLWLLSRAEHPKQFLGLKGEGDTERFDDKYVRFLFIPK